MQQYSPYQQRRCELILLSSKLYFQELITKFAQEPGPTPVGT